MNANDKEKLKYKFRMMQLNNAYNLERTKLDKVLWFFLLLIISLLIKFKELSFVEIEIIAILGCSLALIILYGINSNIKEINEEMRKIIGELS